MEDAADFFDAVALSDVDVPSGHREGTTVGLSGYLSNLIFLISASDPRNMH